MEVSVRPSCRDDAHGLKDKTSWQHVPPEQGNASYSNGLGHQHDMAMLA